MSEFKPSLQSRSEQPHQLTIDVQYLKSLSFEVCGAPQLFSEKWGQPQANTNVDVQVRRLKDDLSVFEVSLVVRAEMYDKPLKSDNETLPSLTKIGLVGLTYAGVFTLSGLSDDLFEPVLLVECPRILFPSVRNVLLDVTREGGIPAVTLQPIDFAALWRLRREQMGNAE